MKTALYAGLLAILLITVPPLAAAGQSGPARLQEETTDWTSPGATLPAPEVETAPGSYDRSFRLPVSTPDGVQSFTLHDYLTGVLLAELPSDFAPEAMKAQAVEIGRAHV